MTDKTIAIVGAGPGLGLSIANRFGREGFQVALVARNKGKLANLTADLKKSGITAEGFVGDVTKESTIVQAFRDVERRFGQVDVLEYSPVNIPEGPAGYARLGVTKMTPVVAQETFSLMALGAVASVGQVLPGMLKRKEGSILITTGASAKAFAPTIGAWGMAGAAVRNYARTLGVAVRDQASLSLWSVLACRSSRAIRSGIPITSPKPISASIVIGTGPRCSSIICRQA